MKFAEFLDATLKEFKISGKDLAVKSGVTEASISRFRRGERDIQAESLERLLMALPPDARQYLFFKLVIGDMDQQGIATLLNAIAYHLKSENSEIPHMIQSEAVLSLR